MNLADAEAFLGIGQLQAIGADVHGQIEPAGVAGAFAPPESGSTAEINTENSPGHYLEIGVTAADLVVIEAQIIPGVPAYHHARLLEYAAHGLAGTGPGDIEPQRPGDAAAAQEALNFFAWAYAKGDEAAAALDYVPMPINIKKLVQSKWSEIKGPDGKPVWNAKY